MFDLENIKDPSFVKSLNVKELKVLAEEIRAFLIENISKTGGHLSSNLGVVELTIALYYVFDPKEVDVLFDVGHQCYTHKILTGRAKEFKQLRQFGGLSGYINREESEYDIWESGHSSTSISAMSGIMLASKKRCISVIGDSSIMNGVAMEGLTFLGQIKGINPVVILNDNKMGITKSVGALTRALTRLRGSKFHVGLKRVLTKIFPNWLHVACHKIKRSFKALIQKDNVFEDLGFDYYGPYDGNDIVPLIKALKRIKIQKEPILLHVLTKKGKGYAPSEADTTGNFHGVEPFDIKTGKPLVSCDDKISYSKLVANYLVEKRKTKEFKVITPATKAGAKLDEFNDKYPKDFYDVGIAEEHAAVMAAGMAIAKTDVVLLMYSTFAQRAYDEILNDIARQDLKVILGLDRAGIVGEDGITHQGIYDVSMLLSMPNIIVTMPKDAEEAIGLFNYAFTQKHPFAIRYPRCKLQKQELDYNQICDLSWPTLRIGKKGIIISYGPDVERLNHLVEENNFDLTVINARSLKPIDSDALENALATNLPILVFEQNVASGTLYSKILEYKEEHGYTNKIFFHGFKPGIEITFGSLDEVYSHYGWSDSEFINFIKEKLSW
ncbi:1-deoxy-D-xylulose-5-phosphate synthase [Anaeroplasma bactoclasticum]|jgi:1-deoxy-D-xylulose-5-phosphate synthase|uniref:1-deoxy-D-xylulose-5-phosphate synthase n=1 Tax=Anaeroplasma bactoclasticum TaxID=2088 RepID=A0A397QUP8_9MOLU|nr:1-deoxy-D-xylulose-5-phosphate synthase [Anaeroplasma bactoclasticum]RIA64782.1 1-deoxy-D-xylulose-5-phosphate synthase [Anaeroplasma bactoclasticum]